MCLDPYTRVLKQARLQEWNTEWKDNFDYLDHIQKMNVTEGVNITKIEEDYAKAVASSITTTIWEADVLCSGCSDIEPLFDPNPALDVTRHLQMLSFRHRLEESDPSRVVLEYEDLLAIFGASFIFNLKPVLMNNAASIFACKHINLCTQCVHQLEASSNISSSFFHLEQFNIIQVDEIMEAIGGMQIINASTSFQSIGVKEIQEFLSLVEANGGTLERPFVKNELTAIATCLDEVSVSESAFCKAITSSELYNLEEVSNCIKPENVNSLSCQDL